MKKITLTTIFVLICAISSAQINKQWDKSYGTSSSDYLQNAILTDEPALLVAGYTDFNRYNQISGYNGEINKNGRLDFLLAKFDFDGNLIWEKSYGGGEDDIINTVIQISDGSYILGGLSESNIGGDKSEVSRGNRDFWLIKIDQQGNVIWDRTYGGSGYDELYDIEETSGGELFLVGTSVSNISGDKSQNNRGTNGDYWIIKTDSNGNKIWDKTYGGSISDIPSSSYLRSDNSLVVLGTSNSNASGEKSQNSRGERDIWLLSIDSDGNILWDKTYGGASTESVNDFEIFDSKIIIPSNSQSRLSGDKSDFGFGNGDGWVLQLDDLGNKLFDKSFGGFSSDGLVDVAISGNNYLFSGYTRSSSSGNSTTTSKGQTDFWLVKTDSNGNKIWDFGLGGEGSETVHKILATGDNEFFLVGQSTGGPSGDKTAISFGGSDFWIVKISEPLPFVTTWDTRIVGGFEGLIRINTYENLNYDYNVDWGDGFTSSNVSGDITHFYEDSGIYEVTINGDFPGIDLGSSTLDKRKLVEINQWGDISWETFENAFNGCLNLDVKATDTPDLSSVQSIQAIFGGCTSLVGNESFELWDVSNITDAKAAFAAANTFNQDIGLWDVNRVEDMAAMFLNCENFNQDISSWDVSNVQTMQQLFNGASNFNQDIGLWDVDNVEDMSSMFSGAESFNQDISEWEVAKVLDMRSMFSGAINFNSSLENWNVSQVVNMITMFSGATSFNGALENWDVSNVINMGGMFNDASAFNQNISSWDISSSNSMSSFLTDALSFSKDNYDSLLAGWSKLELQPNLILGAEGLTYCISKEDREKIITDFGWSIIDGGQDCRSESCADLANLALEKSAEQSSTYGDGSASIAVDGNTTGDSPWTVNATIQHTNSGEFQPWWQVDLGDVYQIEKINIFNRNSENSFIRARLNNFYILISQTPFSPDLGLDDLLLDPLIEKTYFPNSAGLEESVDFSAIGRYVRIQLSTEGTLHMAEVEVLGCRNQVGTRPFVTTWKTDNPGTSEDNQITIPTFDGETYDYVVDWGDGTTSENVMGDITHTYVTPGTYTVSISGDFPRINFFKNFSNRTKLTTIEQWGDIEWNSMERAFLGCDNLNVVATDAPNLSQVTSLSEMFNFCESLTGNESFVNWNVSTIQNMSRMFAFATSFNQDLSEWDVSSVLDMSFMFDPDTGISTENYDKTIIGWSQLPTLQNGVRLDVENFYCISENARQSIIDTYNWTINDAGFGCLLEGPQITTKDAINFLENNTGVVIDVESNDNNDIEGAGLMYALIGSIDDDLFSIDVVTGEITFLDSPNFEVPTDVDANNVYELIVTVTDSEGFADRQKITITVLKNDGSNLDSDFDGILDEFDLCSNTPPGQVVDENGCEFNNVIYEHLVENFSKWFGGDNRPDFGPRNLGTGQSLFVDTDISIESFAVKFQDEFDFSNNPEGTGHEVDLILQVRDLNGDVISNTTNILSSSFRGGWVRFVFEVPLELIGDKEYYFTWYLKDGLTNSYDTGSIGDTTSSFQLGNGLSSRIDESGSDSDFNNFQNWFKADLDYVFKITGAKLENRPFITTWKTDNLGLSEDNQITIPTFPGETYNYIVYWGDGTTSENVTGDSTHTYETPGIYTVTIAGDFPRIYFGSLINQSKLLSVDQWGDIKWTSMENAFSSNDQLVIEADDAPDLSLVTSLERMFLGCQNMRNSNGSLNDWDVSRIQNMSNMFAANSFNGELSSWDVSTVLDMSSMFGLSNFNKDISNWNVSNVTNMNGMFNDAVFNQSLENWDVSSVISMSGMFGEFGGFSNTNYDKTLMGWSQLPSLQNNVQLDAPSNQFCLSEEARQSIIDIYGWTINDGGKAVDCEETECTSFTNIALNKSASQSTTYGDGVASIAVDGNTFGDSPWTTDATLQHTISGEFQSWWQVDLGESSVIDAINIFNRTDKLQVRLNNFYILIAESPFSETATLSDLLADSSVSKFFFEGEAGLEENFDFDANGRYVRVQLAGTGTLHMAEVEVLGCAGKAVPRPFVTTWKTDNSGVSEDNQITIPTFPGETYNYTVDWGDGTSTENVTGDITHTYFDAGEYTVSIYGDFPRIYLNYYGDSNKLLSVNNWGDIQWSSMESAFAGARNLDVLTEDVPNFSQVTTTANMFANCRNLKGTISFDDWDVSNLRNMDSMFVWALLFNQQLSEWNVSNVENMNYMFGFNLEFNGDISNWNTSNVEIMAGMFDTANSFNQDIGNWNVSNLKDMSYMFLSMETFNQDISGWDVSNVTKMTEAFQSAPLFNQDLSSWRISNVTDMSRIFQSSGLSNENYDKTLIGWSQLPSLQIGVQLDAPNNQYCVSEEARQSIIDTFGWTINDDGKAAGCEEIECAILTNIALNKMAIQSSTYGDGVASIAVDGNTFGDSPWTADATLQHTISGEIQSWWQVDLGETSAIKGLTIFNRSDKLQARLNNFYILISETPFSTTATLSDLLSDDAILNYFFEGEAELEENLNLDTNGRYVRIQLSGTGTLHMAEVEVLGCADEITPKPFVTTWKTDNPGTSEDNQITIPTFPGETYDYTVDWGDGITTENITGDITHSYASSGTYTVSINGDFPRIYFNDAFDISNNDSDKIIAVNSWGNIEWSSMQVAFSGCENLDVIADDVPNLSMVNSTAAMFLSCSNLVGNSKFNEWNMSNIAEMQSMFNRAILFNQPLNNWNTNNALNINGMFSYAASFNQSINSWNIENVENIGVMFGFASSFNQSLKDWDTSSVTNMNGVFAEAIAFNQSLENWDVSNVEDMSGMLDLSGLSNANYDATLIGWSQLGSLQNDVVLGAFEKEYCLSEFARQSIIDNYGWIINDSGKSEDCDITGCSKPGNLAFGKPTEQSTTYGNGISDLAVDGNIIGESPWSADLQHTISGESQSWWQVDLGANFSIENMVIFNRSDKLQSRLNNFYVLVSDTPFSQTATLDELLTNENILNSYFEGEAGQELEIDLVTTGRYVRVQLSNVGTLHMAEVQVFGCSIAVPLTVDLNKMSLYPNPADDYINVSFSEVAEVQVFYVYDISGRMIQSSKAIANENNYLLNVTQLTTGTYFVKAIDNQGVEYYKQMVIKR